MINNTIDSLQKNDKLPKKIAKLRNQRHPKFYTLLHKPAVPGRPVVNSINSHTSRISKYVDFHLQPLAQQLPSYIKDTSHFLRKLDNLKDTNPQSILVTLDVKSLYTNIPNDEGIVVVREAISKSPNSEGSLNFSMVNTLTSNL